MKILLCIHGFGLIMSLILFATGYTHQASGLFFGILIIFLNLALFAWIGSSQKLFALKTPIVVIKYAIWAGLIYLVINKTAVDKLFFIVGLSLIVPSLLIFAIINRRLNHSKKEL